MEVSKYIQDNLSDIECRRRAGDSLTIRLLGLYQMTIGWKQRDHVADTLLDQTFQEYLDKFGGAHG